MTDPVNTSSEAAFDLPLEFSPSAAESPVLRELGAELRRQAKEAVEAEAAGTVEKIRASSGEIEQKRLETERFFEAWKEEFEKALAESRAEFAAHLAEQRRRFAGNASIVLRN